MGDIFIQALRCLAKIEKFALRNKVTIGRITKFLLYLLVDNGLRLQWR